MRMWAVALLGVVVATACVDEKVVYRDVNAVVAPPTAAQGFVGYARQADTQTVCANCHAGAGANWKGTAHARAWADLQASGHATKACEACHSVNAFGNATTGDAGWVATGDKRYQDVQCESCHGPGLNHVSSPTKGNVPLASLKADTTLKDGCGECHSGAHNPFVAEWQKSAHGSMPHSTSPRKQAACQGCHTGQGALAAMGVIANYKEKSMATDTLAIVCGVCHDPHKADKPGQLRFALDAQDLSQNLCMRCHQRRASPELGGRTSPHSPEGEMILGNAGWFPPSLNVPEGTKIQTTHGTSNPRLCATCHVEAFSTKDKLTGQTVYVVGHEFEAIPCVDASGIPTGKTDCTVDERRFNACATSGCHGSPAAAKSAFNAANARIKLLYTELDRLLAQVPASDKASTIPTTGMSKAQGAMFNSALAKLPGSPTHNPYLMESLLVASINQLKIDYPTVKSVSNVDLTLQLKQHP